MATSVRFYDAFVVDTVTGNYNDGTTATGALGKGRFVLTVDPFTAPSGTDGQFDEFDFVVDDPGDSTMVFWGWVGVNVAASPALVTAGFTFDAAAPAGFDYWGCFRDTKADYDAYVAAPHLVVGATNYARNNAIFFDGTYHIQGLGFVVSVNGASAANWWTEPVLPPLSPAPTITAPASGATITLVGEGADSLSVSWTLGVIQTHYEARVVGDASGSPNLSDVWVTSGDVASATTNHAFALPWYRNGSMHVVVRAKASGYDWSAWASVPITVNAGIAVTTACFLDELIADTPTGLWSFAQQTAYAYPNLSGTAGDWKLWSLGTRIDDADHTTGSGNPTLDLSGPEVGADMLIFIVIRGTVGTISADTPTGWTVHDDTGVLNPGGGSLFLRWYAFRRTKVTGDTSVTVTLHNQTGEVRSELIFGPTGYTLTAGTWNVQHYTGAIGGSIASPAGTTTLFGSQAVEFLQQPGASTSTIAGTWAPNPSFPYGGDIGFGGKVFAVRPGDPTQVTITKTTTDDYGWVGIIPIFNETIDQTLGITDNAGTAPVCDTGCAHIYTYGNQAFTGESPYLSCAPFVPSWTELTFELLVRVDADSAVLNGFEVDSSEPFGNAVIGLTGPWLTTPPNRVQAYTSSQGQFCVGDTGEKTGCWYHVVNVFRPVGGALHNIVYVNGVIVRDDPSSGGPTVGNTAFISTWQNASVAAFAVYASALSRGRVVAHLAHLCKLCGGMGFVLGTTTFS